LFCAKEHFWEKFAELTDLSELISDKRFATFALRHQNRETLLPILSNRLRKKTNGEWLALFRGSVPSGPINSIKQALEDEQIKARGMIVDVEHPTYGTIKQVTSPIATEGANRAVSPGPGLGEHTNELLAELLSLDSAEIQRLRNQGSVG